MSAVWVNDTQNRIYTLIKFRTSKKFDGKYPDLNFTMDDDNQIKTEFPTVFIQFMPSQEQGVTIDTTSINAFTCGVQIDVTVSKKMGQTTASEVIWTVVEEFKRIGFQVQSTPQFISTGNETKRIVSRVRRNIGSSDSI